MKFRSVCTCLFDNYPACLRFPGRAIKKFILPKQVILFLIAFTGSALAAEMNTAPPSPAELKRLSLEELMNMEVTSVSKRPEKLTETASAIQVITREDIRRAGVSSFPEALRLADNLNVAQTSSAGWKISARGFNAEVGNKLLALVDGRSIYTGLFSGVIWNVQDYLLEDIDRIEVISGPGGALWGANAVNGVINIITRSAKETQGAYVEAGGGTELRGFTGVRYGGTLVPDVYYRVYGKFFDLDGAVLADGADVSDSWYRGQGGFRLDAETSARDLITLQGDFYRGITNTPSDDTGKASGGNVLARWSHTISDESNLSLQMYYDRTHLAAPFPASGAIPAGILKDDLDTVDLDFQHHYRWGERQQIVWGLGYRYTHDEVENAPTVAFIPETLDHDLFSAFVQDEIKLHEKLYFTIGTKLEHYDYTGFEFEPSARLRWNITSTQMAWGAVSRAVRTPSRYDRDLFQPNPLYGIFLGGNTTFRSETVIAYELGYRTQLGQKLSGSVSAFYNDYDHLRSLGFTPITLLPLVFQNGLKAKTYGFEINASYQALDWWRLHAGYNFLREDIDVRSSGVDLFNTLNETADPRHQFSFHTAMDLPQDLELDAGLRWVDTLHNNSGPTAGTVPDYVELDIRMGWRPNKAVELSIVGHNLLHGHHPEFGFPGPAREEIERSVSGKATWRF